MQVASIQHSIEWGGECVITSHHISLNVTSKWEELDLELPNSSRFHYKMTIFLHFFAGLPCIVGEWSHWSGCAEQCKPNFRMRTRSVQQDPQNGGEPCPPLEEKAGCLEYANYEGQDCGEGHGTCAYYLFEFVIMWLKSFKTDLFLLETECGKTKCTEYTSGLLLFFVHLFKREERSR